MSPTNDRDDLSPMFEPSPGFADRVLGRVATLEVLRATVEAEDKRAADLLVVAVALGGIPLGGLASSLLLPPLLALRVTACYALEWASGIWHGAALPGLLLALAAGGAAWLACEFAPLLRAERRPGLSPAKRLLGA